MSEEDVQLHNLRGQIDELDEELLRILALRMAIARQIGAYKKAHNLALTDPTRQDAVLEKQLERAKSAELPEEFIRQLYTVIYHHTIAVEAGSS